MNWRKFLKKHRKEIDQAMKQACPNRGRINDRDRRQWVANDEGWSRWAKRACVKGSL